MRIALLEVVQRAVHEVLLHLLPGALVAQVVRRPGAVDRLDAQRVHLGVGVFVGSDVADVAADRVEEHVLELAAQRQQRRVPLPAGIDAGEPAVVQLVADVQRQVKIEPVRVGIADRRRDAAERPLWWPTGQQVKYGRRDTAPPAQGSAGSSLGDAIVTRHLIPCVLAGQTCQPCPDQS